MSYNCEFCKKSFSTKSTMKTHQQSAKYCLRIQNKPIEDKFKCDGCGKKFTTLLHINRHMEVCKTIEVTFNLREKIKFLENNITELQEYKSKYLTLLEDNIEQKDQYETKIQHLQDKLENIAIKAVSRPFEDETTIDIEHDDLLSDSDFIIEETDDEEEEYKQLPPLEVGKGYSIEYRNEDGYVNVTNLCKSGGKQYKHWKSIQKTKAFLKVLSMEVGIPTSNLIKVEQTSNINKCTWVHPQVAINIAQWISPSFDVKVSRWVYEIMMTGKVDITNTTPYKQLQEESKKKSIRIRLLEKMNLKRQPRTQYKEKYVIYILTTALMKKERRYILGKAKDLTPRLSTYNKSDEHEVIYYQSCGDEETMGCVETMVFQYLKQYR